MSDDERSNLERPTLFCLHYLGGSAREWERVARRLGARFDIVALDLPGFGDAANVPGYAVAEMAETIAHAIRAAEPSHWFLAGHSMGAKVAAAIARGVENGTNGLTGLAGLVLVAGSPPSPEPMEESDRDEMLGWFAGDAASRLDDARTYVTKNGGPKLDADATDLAVADVLRANRAAWRAWLTGGSREDWAQRVGVLETPALLIAGADDANLGPDAQRRLGAPHFADARVLTLAGAKHLLPLECADEVAAAIAAFANERAYRTLIASPRVSSKTRDILLERAKPDDASDEPAALDRDGLATLRAVLDRVIPQTGSAPIDLAARIDRRLDGDEGDGWRFAVLPPDAEAYRLGLRTLNTLARKRHGRSFVELDDDRRDALLTAIAEGAPAAEDDAGNDAPSSGRLDAKQMKAWFEDVRADAVKLYVAHPDTLARMGYSGIANGGDGTPKSGFVRIGIDERESWEPIAADGAGAR